MKKIVLILFVLSSLFLSWFTVSAQDIDISTLSDEQLITLLQSITNRLQSEETETTVESEPEPAEEPVEKPAAASTEDPVTEEKKFRIYENKKLIIGRMPDSMFVPRETGGGEEEGEPETPEKKEETPTCPPGATYDCYTDIYGWRHCGCGYG